MNANNRYEVTGALVSPHFPSSADVDHHVEQARWLRARATSELFASTLQPIVDDVRVLGERMADWRRRHATRVALMRCSDRVLADIGVEREDIPLIARGTDPRDVDVGTIGPIVRGARVLGERIADWRRRQATRVALMRCSDRVLADIGVEREDIPLIARGTDPRDVDVDTIGWRGRWAWLRGRLEAARSLERQQRQIYRELMDYRDHELNDLGIRRTDIAGIARGGSPAAA